MELYKCGRSEAIKKLSGVVEQKVATFEVISEMNEIVDKFVGKLSDKDKVKVVKSKDKK